MKTAVIYWSGTGNTEAMARAVAEGMTAAGAEAVLLTPAEVGSSRPHVSTARRITATNTDAAPSHNSAMPQPPCCFGSCSTLPPPCKQKTDGTFAVRLFIMACNVGLQPWRALPALPAGPEQMPAASVFPEPKLETSVKLEIYVSDRCSSHSS